MIRRDEVQVQIRNRERVAFVRVTHKPPWILYPTQEEPMLQRIRERISVHLATLLEDLLEDSPEDSGGFLRVAKLRYRQHDYLAAIANLDITLRHAPLNSDALYLRCCAKYEDGQTDAALLDAIEATKLRPDDAPSHYMLGNILRARKCISGHPSR